MRKFHGQDGTNRDGYPLFATVSFEGDEYLLVFFLDVYSDEMIITILFELKKARFIVGP
jgi:hypothetical protein